MFWRLSQCKARNVLANDVEAVRDDLYPERLNVGVLRLTSNSARSNDMKIDRPFYTTVSVSDAIQRDWRGWHLSEKMDGIWQAREYRGSILTGEVMNDGRFFAFDIPVAFGEDIRNCTWLERQAVLLDIAATFPAGMALCASGNGEEFIEAILARGGEGVIAKHFKSYWGMLWHKIERIETFDCVITAIDYTRGSIQISLNGEDCGWCPAQVALFHLRIGDVVEIATHRRHPDGKFRKAMFLRIRTDKMQAR